jgi:UDP-3-O-[3-hydroxymyristoyl] glucosamine N-acyltransferase
MRISLDTIAGIVEGELKGDGSLEISGVGKIEDAREGDITFLANKKYLKYLEKSRATAVIVPMEIEEAGDKALIRVQNPYFAFLKMIRHFNPPVPLIEEGVHPSAVVGEKTELGEGVSIGARVVVGRRCEVGDGTVILPGTVIGDDVTIGKACLIHANVSVREHSVLGDRVIIQNGAVIGSDGFGFAPEGGEYHKIPQVGIVVLEDDVEVGANTTIDRATMGETRIKKGAKLDNLIQVGHNCTVGESTVMAAQAGLSGSTHIGTGVRVGGQAGFAGHMKVGDGAAIGAQSGIDKDIPPGQFVFGCPARPHMEAFRTQAMIRKLPQFMKEWKMLKEKIRSIEKKMGE